MSQTIQDLSSFRIPDQPLEQTGAERLLGSLGGAAPQNAGVLGGAPRMQGVWGDAAPPPPWKPELKQVSV